MKIIETIKQKVKGIARKIAGEPAAPPSPNFSTVYVIKNGEKVYEVTSNSDKLTDGFINTLSYFHKYNDYKIIYNYIERTIAIYFTVKKSNDVEGAGSSSDNK